MFQVFFFSSFVLMCSYPSLGKRSRLTNPFLLCTFLCTAFCQGHLPAHSPQRSQLCSLSGSRLFTLCRPRILSLFFPPLPSQCNRSFQQWCYSALDALLLSRTRRLPKAVQAILRWRWTPKRHWWLSGRWAGEVGGGGWRDSSEGRLTDQVK